MIKTNLIDKTKVFTHRPVGRYVLIEQVLTKTSTIILDEAKSTKEDHCDFVIVAIGDTAFTDKGGTKHNPLKIGDVIQLDAGANGLPAKELPDHYYIADHEIIGVIKVDHNA